MPFRQECSFENFLLMYRAACLNSMPGKAHWEEKNASTRILVAIPSWICISYPGMHLQACNLLLGQEERQL